MEGNFKRMARGLGMLSRLIGVLALAAGAGAWAEGEAYLRDTRGGYVRNSGVGDARIGNLCWRTGYWTPAQAVAACDRDLMVVSDPPSVPVDPPAPPAPKPPLVIDHPVTFALDVFFDFDKSVLKPEAKIRLDELLGKLARTDYELVIIVGHTDGIGGAAYNDALSLRRAAAVKAYLVSRKVEPQRIYTEGKGRTQPIADNRSAEGRAKNRRVEIEVVPTRKR